MPCVGLSKFQGKVPLHYDKLRVDLGSWNQAVNVGGGAWLLQYTVPTHLVGISA